MFAPRQKMELLSGGDAPALTLASARIAAAANSRSDSGVGDTFSSAVAAGAVAPPSEDT